ncbi:MAG TPA: monovalent cation/H(+) antiporter subunit G [Burkholderiaceae bacterium]|nr:monovalent cation/H(+) antiporter subunit G [Burkholderiaceae bacterium]
MNTLPLWAGIPAAILIVLGGLIALTGSLGLLRFSEFHARIHAPAIINTLGATCLVAASILIWFALDSGPIFQEILILLFLVITSPITAMLLMRAASRHHGDNEQRHVD